MCRSLSQGDLDTLEPEGIPHSADKETRASLAEEDIEVELEAADDDAENEEAEDASLVEEEVSPAEEEPLPTSSQPDTIVNSDAEDQEQGVVAGEADKGDAMQIYSSSEMVSHILRSHIKRSFLFFSCQELSLLLVERYCPLSMEKFEQSQYSLSLLIVPCCLLKITRSKYNSLSLLAHNPCAYLLPQEDELQSDEATGEEILLEESAAISDDPDSFLSTHSSYANVSMADGQSHPSETVDQVSLCIEAVPKGIAIICGLLSSQRLQVSMFQTKALSQLLSFAQLFEAGEYASGMLTLQMRASHQAEKLPMTILLKIYSHTLELFMSAECCIDLGQFLKTPGLT